METIVNKTRSIEQSPDLEERAKVKLVGLFASVNEIGWLTVNGEIKPADSDQLEKDVLVTVDVLDKNGRILGTSCNWFYAEKFWKFESFSFSINLVTKKFRKIRVYPKTEY
jgi:hypothetical protein